MTEKRIYFVRHGETEGNHLWKHQSKSVPLTARGALQARAAAKVLGTLPIDLVITSGATRTQQTALPLLERVHCPVVNNLLFEELRRPSSLIGKNYFNPYALWTIAMVYLHANNAQWRHTDEETLPEFRTRAKDAVAFLEKQKAEHIVVVSHRVFISGMLALVSGYHMDGTISFLRAAFHFGKIANGSITELSYDPAREAPWRIARVNDTSHLRGL